MGETPNWDSLNHVVLIGELESSYEQILNEDIGEICYDEVYNWKNTLRLTP